ncbi:MAG: hypothetical protein AAGA95_01335 [Pseudomonadota bacterium]
MNWRPYILPGLIFQSVIIGGGYATGRELIEFFAPSGPAGGILGLLVAGVTFALVLSAAFEFARVFRAYDYRSFARQLLGRAWVLYELGYLALVVLVLAVVGAASGELLEAELGLPPALGTIVMMLLVAWLTFGGSGAISRALSYWSALLYCVYVLLFIAAFVRGGEQIQGNITGGGAHAPWVLPGIRYASYNIILPAVLFCMPLLETRRQALGAGALAGVIAVVPALLFFLAMLSRYPQIVMEPVPVLYLMAWLDTGWLVVLFQIVVFGTFVETGAGMLHAINERVEVQVRERGRRLPRWARPVIAGCFLLLSVYGATTVGIVDLIAKGYGFLSWWFIAVLLIPLLTVGVWRIGRSRSGS